MDQREKIEYIAHNYAKAMHAKACSVLNDYHEAEDACQEALIHLYRVIDRIEDVTSPSAKAYCIKTARNCAIDIQRKKCHETPAAEIYDDAEEAAIYDFYPSDTADMADDIEQLPEKYRKIIQMRCLEEKSADETAKELNTNVNTVNTQLMRARKILKAKWIGTAAMIACGLVLICGITVRMIEDSRSYSPAAGTDSAAVIDTTPVETAADSSDFTDAVVTEEEARKAALDAVDGAAAEDIVSCEPVDSAEGGYRILIRKGAEVYRILISPDGRLLEKILCDQNQTASSEQD